jgi:3-dehydroquinate synthase
MRSPTPSGSTVEADVEVRVPLGERSYVVRIGSLADLPTLRPDLTGRTLHVVVDARVLELHGDRLRAALAGAAHRPPLEVAAGEEAKSPDGFLHLCRRLLEAGVDREAVLVAVGGGATCDVTGFAAASLHRGLDWIPVPTTLLAMVDASVGGKTAIDLDDRKNAIGAFHQPAAVLADPNFLGTLDRRDRIAGLVEAFKIGLVRDEDLARAIADRAQALADGEAETLVPLIGRAIELKAAVVAEDEREAGSRALLNFGHTIGHALESASGFRRWRHGEAVSIGIVAALRLSVRVSRLEPAAAAWAEGALAALGAPVGDPETPWSEVARRLPRDRKARGGWPAFVLTPRIGSGTFGHRISQDIVAEEVAGLFGGDG